MFTNLVELGGNLGITWNRDNMLTKLREPRESRWSREPREPREPRDSRDSREFRRSRRGRGYKGFKPRRPSGMDSFYKDKISWRGGSAGFRSKINDTDHIKNMGILQTMNPALHSAIVYVIGNRPNRGKLRTVIDQYVRGQVPPMPEVIQPPIY